MNAVGPLISMFASSVAVQRIGWTLLHSVWQAGLIALVLKIALVFVNARKGGTSSNAAYLMGYAALLALPVAAAFTFAYSVPESGSSRLPEVALTAPTVTRAAMPAIMSTPGTMDVRGLLPLAVAVWGAGLVLQMAVHCVGWARLHRLRRESPLLARAWVDGLAALAVRLGIGRPVLLLASAKVDIPFVLGVMRPAIIVPLAAVSGFSPEQIQAVLAHELAHIRRHDYLANLVQAVIEAAFFYHPAMWWISAQVRRERENCCDDIAAGVCGRVAYARSLVMLEERRGGSYGLAPAMNDGALLPRIRRLVAGRSQDVSKKSPALAVLAIVAVVVFPIVIAGRSAALKAQEVVQPKSATTTASSPYHEYRVTIGQNGFIAVDGAVGNWQTLRHDLQQLSPAERGNVVIALIAETGNLPVATFFEAQAQASRLVTELGLRYVSTAGVADHVRKDGQAEEGGTAIPPAEGELNRLRSQLNDWRVRLARVQQMYGPNHPEVKRDEGYIDVLEKQIADREKEAATSRPASIPFQSAEIYVAGIVARPGVYSVAGRRITILQLLVSCGLDLSQKDRLFVRIRRRTADGQEVDILKDVRESAILSRETPDVYLEPNDMIFVTAAGATQPAVDPAAR